MKPAVFAVKVQAGVPKLQTVGLNGVGTALDMPNTTEPAVATCTFLVTRLVPAGMTNPDPVLPPVELSQLTVGGGPEALKVPVTPPV